MKITTRKYGELTIIEGVLPVPTKLEIIVVGGYAMVKWSVSDTGYQIISIDECAAQIKVMAEYLQDADRQNRIKEGTF